MDMIALHMNTTQGGATLHPGTDLHPGVFLLQGANTAHEHGLTHFGKRDSFFLKGLQRLQQMPLPRSRLRHSTVG